MKIREDSCIMVTSEAISLEKTLLDAANSLVASQQLLIQVLQNECRTLRAEFMAYSMQDAFTNKENRSNFNALREELHPGKPTERTDSVMFGGLEE